MRIDVSCMFCRASVRVEAGTPKGWTNLDEIDIEDRSLCPRHAAIQEFSDSQCPGCVGGWGECSLWNDFAYQKKALTDRDFESIRRGICPRRVNGIFALNNGEHKVINLSEVATVESGEALEAAIKDYWERYAEHYKKSSLQ